MTPGPGAFGWHALLSSTRLRPGARQRMLAALLEARFEPGWLGSQIERWRGAPPTPDLEEPVLARWLARLLLAEPGALDELLCSEAFVARLTPRELESSRALLSSPDAPGTPQALHSALQAALRAVQRRLQE